MVFEYHWTVPELNLKKHRKIDAHAHIQELGDPFNVGITERDMLRLMEEYSIELAVISDVDNEKIMRIVRGNPDRFIGIYWANPRAESPKEAEDNIINSGFRGIKLHPLLHMFRPSSVRVRKIVEIAGKLGIPVFIHTGHAPTSLPSQVARLVKDFPDVKFVFVHMGHGNAYYIQEAIDIGKELDNVYLETSGMPMSSKIAEAYLEVPDRVMFGTDVPCHHPAVEIVKVLSSGLNEKALRKVFYENAKELLEL
ncbi:metal-dependent hydrolase [Pyrococcus yayanosii CH1]|uniref:Metal-dependent hydrolase n=2 Tax=Pyrococcus TaxID=2260 RepID=F8AHU1_PYRYC|nr:metal-dependent hydrolase [Pyrococcus yayanosii CH1]